MEYYQLYLSRIHTISQIDLCLLTPQKEEIFSLRRSQSDKKMQQLHQDVFRWFFQRLLTEPFSRVLVATRRGMTYCGGYLLLAQGPAYLVAGPICLQTNLDRCPDKNLRVFQSVEEIYTFLPLLFDHSNIEVSKEEGRQPEPAFPLDETIPYNNEDAILKNAALEQQICAAVQSGDLQQLRELRRTGYFRSPGHYDVGSDLRNRINLSLALNTMTSRAAAQGGASVVYVRSICAVFAARLEKQTSEEALVLIRWEFCETYCRAVAAARRAAVSPAVRRCMEYMQMHLSEDICLEELARHCCVSYEYLSRLIKKECGQTYRQLLRQMRIERAKLYLKQAISVQETAERTGFKTAAHFCRVFKAETGCTPSQWLCGVVDAASREQLGE